MDFKTKKKMAIPVSVVSDVEKELMLLQEPLVTKVQENTRQEITEVLQHRELPEIPQVLQRVAEPMQEQPVPPGDLSFKQQWKIRRLDKKAQKKNKLADHVSIAIKEQMDEYTAEHEAESKKIEELTKHEQEQGEESSSTGKALKAFTTGYKTNKHGKPLNEQENAKKLRDDKFMEDYSSGELQRRLPHLERIKNEMLNIRISPDMLTDTYMERHAAEVYGILAKMTYFQNVQNDAVNAPYFKKLPEHEKKLLGYLRNDLAGPFANAWTHMLIRKGFTNKGSTLSYINDQEMDIYEPLAQQALLLNEVFRNQVRSCEQKKEEVWKEVQRTDPKFM